MNVHQGPHPGMKVDWALARLRRIETPVLNDEEDCSSPSSCRRQTSILSANFLLDLGFFTIFFPFFSIMVCPMRLSISPCALQQDLVIYPVYREQFASTDPKPPARLSPSPTPLQPQSLCCVRRSVCVCRYVGRCHMLGFTCKRCPSCSSFSLLLVSNLLTFDLISTEQQHHPVKHNKPPPRIGAKPRR